MCGGVPVRDLNHVGCKVTRLTREALSRLGSGARFARNALVINEDEPVGAATGDIQLDGRRQYRAIHGGVARLDIAGDKVLDERALVILVVGLARAVDNVVVAHGARGNGGALCKADKGVRGRRVAVLALSHARRGRDLVVGAAIWKGKGQFG